MKCLENHRDKTKDGWMTCDFTSFLTLFQLGRSRAVVLDGERSDGLPVLSGVHRGSVLGPVLFLLYIGDLPENVQSQVRLFADDTAVCLAVQGSGGSERLRGGLGVLRGLGGGGMLNLVHPGVKSCILCGLVALSGAVVPCKDGPLGRSRVLCVWVSTCPRIWASPTMSTESPQMHKKPGFSQGKCKGCPFWHWWGGLWDNCSAAAWVCLCRLESLYKKRHIQG